MSVDLPVLRASAQRGMSEDAEPQHAAAREQLLQLYRDAWIERGHLELSGAALRNTRMGKEDLDGIEWLARLAAAGHVGAKNLLLRSLQFPKNADNLLAVAPERVEALSNSVEVLAQHLAWVELDKDQPDWARVEAKLAKAGAGCAAAASALRALRECGGTPGAQELKLMRANSDDVLDPPLFKLYSARDLLWRFAQSRQAGSDAERCCARRLMERAADLGSTEAAEPLFVEGFTAAASRPAFMEQWFAAGRPAVEASLAPCVQLAVALERGAAGRAPDFDAALRWYERAVARKARRSPGELDRRFCDLVALRLDKRSGAFCKVDDAQLALRWYERALERGGQRSLDTWIKLCADGDAGLAPDPAAALERIRRFRASGVATDARPMFAIGAAEGAAAAAKEPRLAAQWLEVAALLKAFAPVKPARSKRAGDMPDFPDYLDIV